MGPSVYAGPARRSIRAQPPCEHLPEGRIPPPADPSLGPSFRQPEAPAPAELDTRFEGKSLRETGGRQKRHARFKPLPSETGEWGGVRCSGRVAGAESRPRLMACVSLVRAATTTPGIILNRNPRAWRIGPARGDLPWPSAGPDTQDRYGLPISNPDLRRRDREIAPSRRRAATSQS